MSETLSGSGHGAGQSADLEGTGVLVTRPVAQAQGLCRAIERLGGRAIPFPVLEILEPEDGGPLQRVVGALDDYDMAIFISANAVNRALEAILAQRDWPATVEIAVIGRRSAQELEQFGLAPDICPPERFNSEALLELPQMQAVEGRRIVIFRGNGGREFLADTLRRRGARVDYVEAYRRAQPAADNGGLLAALRRGQIDVTLVNSEESLRNLLAMAGAEAAEILRRIPLLVVSERMLPVVRELGFRDPPLVAANATDEAVVEALRQWRATTTAS
ncbi:MAG TPA: uroporphyrinogen-III synthase [Gammaproteobacteria bacterium]|nr:uroporphyrinogen-III synthase [Gammaproteobacteria bacterium]